MLLRKILFLLFNVKLNKKKKEVGLLNEFSEGLFPSIWKEGGLSCHYLDYIGAEIPVCRWRTPGPTNLRQVVYFVSCRKAAVYQAKEHLV